MGDKRLYRRVELFGSARLELQQQAWPVEMLDLSLKGAQLEVPRDFSLDLSASFDCLLVLELDGSDVEISLDGRLIRYQQQTLAMEFTQVELEAMQHLRRLLELNLGADPIHDLPSRPSC